LNFKIAFNRVKLTKHYNGGICVRLFKIMLIGIVFLFIAACDSEPPQEDNEQNDDIPGETDNSETDDTEDDDTEDDDTEDNDTEDNDTEDNDTEDPADEDGIILTFLDHEGNIVDEVEVYENEDFTIPEGPEKEGYYFVQWDYDYDAFTFETDKTIEPIYAINVYAVTINGPEGTIETLTVEHGESLDLETPDSIEGYRFVEYDNVPSTITEDITIEAIYEDIPEVTLNFHDGDGDFMESFTGYLDDEMPVPEVEDYEGYSFEGWGEDGEGTPLDLLALEAGEHDVYAIYKGESVTVTFDFMDGSDPIEKTFEYEEEISISDVIELPERDDYNFSHWEESEYRYWFGEWLEVYQLDPIILEAQWDGETEEWLFDTEDGEAILTEYLGDDTDIVIPENIGGKPVGVIGEALFNNEWNVDGYVLDTLVIGANVHTIEENAFRNQQDLTSVIFDNPDNVRHIKAYAFRRVVADNLMVPSYLETIETYAFDRSSISSVTFNGDIEKIGERAFSASNLSGTVELPDRLREIGASAFADTFIETLVINDGLTTIRRRAFANVSNLKSVTIPASVEVFEERVFADASDLETVIFQSESPLTTIEDSTFRETESLTTIVLPENLEVIGQYAFRGASALETIDIPSSVHTLERYAFAEMTALETITIPEGITTLPRALFRDGTSLTTVNLPESLIIIDNAVFDGAIALETLDIPEGVKEIGNTAFQSAISLHTLELPEGLEVLGQRVFRYTESLSEITIPEGVTKIDAEAFAYSHIETVNLHDEITYIGWQAFRNTPYLTSLTLPDSVETVRQEAFRESSIEWIYIHASVTEMEYGVFQDANNVDILYEGPYIPGQWNDNFNPNDRPVYLDASADDMENND